MNSYFQSLILFLGLFVIVKAQNDCFGAGSGATVAYTDNYFWKTEALITLPIAGTCMITTYSDTFANNMYPQLMISYWELTYASTGGACNSQFNNL